MGYNNGMSLMCCHNCGFIYGPTIFQCPHCQSTVVSRVTVEWEQDYLGDDVEAK
jgi:RNA polymerase subunit RPABC4/transcription elongation factor Spt4